MGVLGVGLIGLGTELLVWVGNGRVADPVCGMSENEGVQDGTEI